MFRLKTHSFACIAAGVLNSASERQKGNLMQSIRSVYLLSSYSTCAPVEWWQMNCDIISRKCYREELT